MQDPTQTGGSGPSRTKKTDRLTGIPRRGLLQLTGGVGVLGVLPNVASADSADKYEGFLYTPTERKITGQCSATLTTRETNIKGVLRTPNRAIRFGSSRPVKQEQHGGNLISWFRTRPENPSESKTVRVYVISSTTGGVSGSFETKSGKDRAYALVPTQGGPSLTQLQDAIKSAQ